ncbi:hypothetical protein JFT59_04830 [Pseudomonas sp. MF6784]|nr:hypothetical protein [Pseudomonas sp. MF6784]
MDVYLDLESFRAEMDLARESGELLDFSRKHVLHGIPYVFKDRPNEYYDFKKIITSQFEISFHEVYITGSGKLGFSPHKGTNFDYDSDIDVAIISSQLFDNIMGKISEYQMQIRKNRRVIRESELSMYHEFLEYSAMGWIRPDKLPISFQMNVLKNAWFRFFESISYNKSPVGNYKVAAGVFRTYNHLETYIVSGLEGLHYKKLKDEK